MRKTISFALATAIVLGNGCRHECAKRHEAMWRAMAGREIGGNNERRNLAAVPRPMPSAAQFRTCYSRSYARSHHPASNWFLVPVANAAAPVPAASPAASNQSVMKQCGAQWQAAKAAGTTSGATWPQFLKACRAQLASTTSAPPQGGFAPATPAPAPAPSPAPTQSGSLFPWQRPAAPPAGSAASSGGGSASPQEAQYRCPGSTVVWVNEHSQHHYFPGTRDYGNTKSGAYMCEAEAQTAGNRAAKNERHP